jgi:hypothetical protein
MVMVSESNGYGVRECYRDHAPNACERLIRV